MFRTTLPCPASPRLPPPPDPTSPTLSDPELGDAEPNGDTGSPEPFLARLVLESELLATGRAAPTGIHLALWGPDCMGLDAVEVANLWGWTGSELAALESEDEHFILVLQTPGRRWGEARAEVLANVLIALRPDEALGMTVASLIEAMGTPAGQAEGRGLREAQRLLTRVFGLRDPQFGSGRTPAPGAPHGESTLFLDTQLDVAATNGLLPGSCALLEEYAELPNLIRLPWPKPDGTP